MNSNDKYKQVILEVPELTHDISDLIISHDPKVNYASNIDYPRGEYGFHHFIHVNKIKKDMLKQFEGKKKVYNVFTEFEQYVDDYDKSIGKETISYFKLKNELHRDFFKYWEIIMLIDVVDLKESNFTSVHICDQNGSFIQAFMNYRNMFSKKNKTDKHYILETNFGCDNKTMNNKFMSDYQKDKIVVVKTMKDKVDLVTCDLTFPNSIDENMQEQYAFNPLLNQINTSIGIIKKGGNLICKFDETFTKTSLKIVILLRQLFSEMYFIKPLFSKSSESDKYCICMDFKHGDNSKELNNITKKMESLIKNINENTSKNIIDIFPTYEIPKIMKTNIIQLNQMVSNNQMKNIGEIIDFVKKEIYNGERYHEKRNEQIEASKYWINTFMPKTKDDKLYIENVNKIIETSKTNVDTLNEILIPN